MAANDTARVNCNGVVQTAVQDTITYQFIPLSCIGILGNALVWRCLPGEELSTMTARYRANKLVTRRIAECRDRAVAVDRLYRIQPYLLTTVKSLAKYGVSAKQFVGTPRCSV